MSSTDLDNDVRTLRIIGGALIAGPTLFTGVVIFLRMSGHALPPRPPLLTYIAPAFALVAVVAHLVPTGKLAGLRDAIADRPARALKARTLFIARLALAEFAALFGCVAYLLEGHIVALAVSLAMITFMLALQYPTATRVDDAIG